MRRAAVITVLITLVSIVGISATADPGASAAPKWSISRSPNPRGASYAALNAITCTSTSDCIAVGYSSVPSVYKVLIERWDGHKWQIMAGRNKSRTRNMLNGVSCVGPTNCFAVGFYDSPGHVGRALIEHWDGKRWAVMSAPSPPGADFAVLHSVACVRANSCFAVGYEATPKARLTLVEHWDGKRWSIMPSPKPAGAGYVELAGVACPSEDRCVAVGFAEFRSGSRTLVERWNGRAWQIVASPTPAGSIVGLRGVACTSPQHCFAVGIRLGRTASALVERWDGRRWRVVTTPKVAGKYGGTLTDVTCPSATSCYAVGSRANTNYPKTLVEHWDGNRWQIMASPNAPGSRESFLSAVSCPLPTKCFAVGTGRKTLVERYQ